MRDTAARGRPQVFLLAAALVASSSALTAQQPTGEAGAEGPAQTAPAPATTPHPEAQRAIDRLRSPFCPGLMLEVCPSPQAAELRDTLQEMARRGASSDSLVTWMLATYGEEWRAVPEARGKGLLAWVLPPLVLLGGIGLITGVLYVHRRSRRREESVEEESPDLSAEERERLEEALRELEASEEPLF